MFESEFTWKLDTGVEVIVTCEGMPYDRESQERDGTRFASAYPLTIGFYIKPCEQIAAERTLSQIKAEYSKIEEHAILVLHEVAESERSSA